MKKSVKTQLLSLTFSFILLCFAGSSASALGLERQLTPNEIAQAAQTNVLVDQYLFHKTLYRGSGGKGLNIPYVIQNTGDMCGPACAVQVTTFLGIKDSSGNAYTQDTVKFKVGWKAGVGTGSDAMTKGLNNLIGRVAYQFTNTANSNLYSSIIYSIDHDYPVIVNVKILPGYDRPVSVGHFILVKGYHWGMSGSTTVEEVTYNDSNGKYAGTHTITGKQMIDACNSAVGNFIRAA